MSGEKLVPEWTLLGVIVLGVVSLAVMDAIRLRRRIAGEVAALRDTADTLQETINVMARQLEQIGATTNGRARAILEQMPEYLVVHDRDGRITYITPAAAEVMNSTPEELIGTTSQERGDGQEGTLTFHEFANLSRMDGKIHRGEITYQAQGTDKRRRLEFYVGPLRNGIITGTVTVFRDISNIYTSRFS